MLHLTLQGRFRAAPEFDGFAVRALGEENP